MNKLSADQKALYKVISRILWEKWDPIGVYKLDAEWNGEYDSYVPQVFRLAIEGKDAVGIASFLSTSAERNMGLSVAKEHDLNIAKLIVKTKQEMLG